MTPEPGDVVFAHSNGIMGRAIRFAERLRGRSGSFYNHVCFVDRVEDGVAFVLQAEPRGVTIDKPISTVGEYLLMRPPPSVDVDRMMFFARKQVGFRYSWLTIAALCLDILTPGWFPTFQPANKRSNSWICSALTGESLRFGGWYHRWPSIYLVTPSQVYVALHLANERQFATPAATL